MKAIVGKKVGMTRVTTDDGRVVAATVIAAEPCAVTQIKTVEKDGYQAIQIGSGKLEKAAKPQQGHAKKSKTMVGDFFVEFRVKDLESSPKLGEEIKAAIFKVGDVVNVVGTSKGHGFTGTVKRHNFKIGPRGHGGMNQREPGSIGSTYPQRVIPGKKMAGRMGGVRMTTKHLKVLGVMADENLLILKGSVPGVKGSRVIVTVSARHQQAEKDN